MSPNRTTYLLGAGASFEAVPIAKWLPKTMAEWASGPARSMSAEVRQHPQFEAFLQGIGELTSAADMAGSIDSYARTLYLSQEVASVWKLRRLKATLSCWLLARQRGGKIDKRYVHFLGGLAIRTKDGPVIFDPNASIITWNYDLQIELVSVLRLGMSARSIVDILHAPPPNAGQSNLIDPNSFCLIRLNGVAGAHRLGDSHPDSGKYQRMIAPVFQTDSMRSMIELGYLLRGT